MIRISKNRAVRKAIRPLLFLLVFVISAISSVYAVQELISLQGKVTTSAGALVNDGNLTVLVYDAPTGGNLVYNSSEDFNTSIQGGSFDVLLGSITDMHLNLSDVYYMDLEINSEDVDWDGEERKQFQSGVGREVSGNFSVDLSDSTFFVDEINNRIGIGTSSPGATLEVTNSSVATLLLNVSHGADLLVINSTGIDLGSGLLYVDPITNKVGIGTADPSRELEVNGNQRVAGTLNIVNSVNQVVWAGFDLSQDASGNLDMSYTGQAQHIMYWQYTGNVGIGTTSPGDALLNVSGTIDAWQVTVNGTALGIYNNGWQTIEEIDLVEVKEYIFNGLNGDEDKIYKIYATGNIDGTATNWYPFVSPNSVSVDPYYNTYHYASDAGSTAVADITRKGFIIGATMQNTANQSLIMETTINAQTGTNRVAHSMSAVTDGATNRRADQIVGVWINSTTNINSLNVSFDGRIFTGKIILQKIITNGTSGFWTQDGSSVYPSSSAWNVGIGTTEPGDAMLNVSGTIDAWHMTINGTAVGTISGWTDDGTVVRLTTSTDNVGIGTSTPANTLNVVGDLNVTGSTYLGNLSFTDNATFIDSVNISEDLEAGGVLFVDGRNGNVGIGTDSPQGKLDINGTYFDSYTKLLLHMDGADGSTGFQDESHNTKAVTPVGTAQIDTAQSKFGGASGLFDGNSDYLQMTDSSDWKFGTGDFTIDFWVRFNNLPTSGNSAVFWVYFADAANEFDIFVYNNAGTQTWRILADDGGDATATINVQQPTTLSTNTWYHMAFVRTGNIWQIYQDGLQVGGNVTDADTVPVCAGATLYIGIYSTLYFDGWLDEFRVSKGIARWTDNFTVPSSAYSADSSERSFFVASDGKVGINTMSPNQSLDVYGNVQSWSYITTSRREDKADIRLKDSSDFDMSNISLYKYKKKNNEKVSDEEYIGLMADEVPADCRKGDGVDIYCLLALDTVQVKELKEENNLLKSELCKKDDSYSWCKEIETSKGKQQEKPVEAPVEQPVNEIPTEQIIDSPVRPVEDIPVNPANSPPVIESFMPETVPIMNVGESQEFTIKASDADASDVLSLQWFVDDLPIVEQTQNSFTFDAKDVGEFEIKVLVTDGKGYVTHKWPITVTQPQAGGFSITGSAVGVVSKGGSSLWSWLRSLF